MTPSLHEQLRITDSSLQVRHFSFFCVSSVTSHVFRDFRISCSVSRSSWNERLNSCATLATKRLL